MTAVFLDFGTVGAGEIDTAPLFEVTPELVVHDFTRAADVGARIAGKHFVFVNKVRLDAAVIDAAQGLRFIGLLATGVNNVDLDAARRNGVAVCNIRDYCTNSVVEHVFAVILELAHSTNAYRQSVRDGNWQNADNFCLLEHPIRELAAMTLGIVGYGNLGRGVADLGRAFGMRVLIARRPGLDPQPDDGRTDLDTLLRSADVVSLHCPLTEANHKLIGARELALLKPAAILVNTARGGLVDSTALVAALSEGRIGGAAIDVLPVEPPVDGDPLLDYPGDNLIVTPHIAWATIEARQNAIRELAANVRSFLDGGSRNRVV